MSNTFKAIDTKNHTYYLFDDFLNVKNFDSDKIKIDEKSYKNISIYYIGYVTIKKFKIIKNQLCKSLTLYY